MEKIYIAVVIAATLDGKAYIVKQFKSNSKKECKDWLGINAPFAQAEIRRPVSTAIVEKPNTL